MEKKTYTVLQDTAKLGKTGATVKMTSRQALYWLKAGVLAEGIIRTDPKPAGKQSVAAHKSKTKKG